MYSLPTVTVLRKSKRECRQRAKLKKINSLGCMILHSSHKLVKTHSLCEPQCFEVSIVSTRSRAISPSPLLSAARLSASSLLAGFWFSSSLLGQTFSWLCYCLLPLGPLHTISHLSDWQAAWLTRCLADCCVCVCVCFYLLKGSETRAPEDRGDKILGHGWLSVVRQCIRALKWFHIVLGEKTYNRNYNNNKK